jgi:hypothetical protein
MPVFVFIETMGMDECIVYLGPFYILVTTEHFGTAAGN